MDSYVAFKDFFDCVTLRFNVDFDIEECIELRAGVWHECAKVFRRRILGY